MYDQRNRRTILVEQRVHRIGVADVEIAMAVVPLQRSSQFRALPVGRPVAAEKALPHVIVDADNVITKAGEMTSRFRPDQSSGAANDSDGHIALSVLPAATVKLSFLLCPCRARTFAPPTCDVNHQRAHY